MVGGNNSFEALKYSSSHNLLMLAETTNFRIKYGFINSSLDICKTYIIVALKMMMRLNFY